ncbi:hypothetical protein KKG46_01615 [Patescibacteria group bacterium]|nr:hypothetical protein [Patescibacteria group bacterium]
MRYIFIPMLSLSLLATGCQNNPASPVDVVQEQERQSCQNNDYEISELALNSTHPILSNSYEVEIGITRNGDCISKALNVALYDADRLVSRMELDGSHETINTVIQWSPLMDSKRVLTARIETADDKQDNNEEEITIDVAPIGNYQNLKYLSSDPVDAGLWKAHSFDVGNPIKLKNASVYLRKYTGENKSIDIIARIYSDKNGQPDRVLQESKIPAEVTNSFEWYDFAYDQSLGSGRYWLVLSLSDLGNINWHFSSNPPFGTDDDSLGMRLVFNDDSQQWRQSQWIINPDRDYSFKISGIEK